MAKGTTFRGAPKPFGGSGHFNEPRRHSLQAKGFKTGHLADSVPMPAPKPRFNAPVYEGLGVTRFPISDKIEIVARQGKSRDGFNHFATLYINGVEDVATKVHYINRTWESYDYQSAIRQAVEKSKTLTPAEKEMAYAYIDKDMSKFEEARVNKEFGQIANIAKLGEIFGKDQKEKNDWKERMLKAGLENKGLEMPEDWDKLDENTKEARLNAVINMMKQPVSEERREQAEPSAPREYAETTYPLEPRYDKRASFYGKAKIISGNNRLTLRSYTTDVAYIENGKAYVNGTYSDTTLRHIKEFLKQNGFEADTKDQIMKDYGQKE